MEFSAQGLSRPWIGGGAIATLALGIAAALSHGAADAAAPALPPELARGLAAHPREARTQLPDGTWLVLERDGGALRQVEDRIDGRTLRRWPLASARRYASLSLLPSGRALLWGGVDANNRLQAGGLWFDPAARTLTTAYEVPLSPRAGHAASVLSDGRLLLTGGWTASAEAGARSELWDERGGAAAPDAQAPARLGHRSRVEADGRVRLSEGVDAHGRAQSRDQLYDPAQRAFAATDASQDASASAAAPRLSGSTPRDRARDVAADARLSLRFSEPLRANELNAANVTLLGPNGFAAVRVTPAEAGRLLFVTPHRRLQPNAEYSLLVDGAHARNGQPLAPTLIDFATGADAGERAPARAANEAPAKTATAKAASAGIVAAPAQVAAPRSAATAAKAQPTATAVAPTPLSVTLAPETAQTIATTLADQTVKLNFGSSSATPVDYGLGLSDLVVSGSSEPATVTYTLPGRPPVSLACAAANNGCGIDLPGLPRGGYSVAVQPPAGATLSFKAGLYRDALYNVQLPSATSVSGLRRGQNARIAFDGTAGYVLGLRVISQTTVPAGRAVNYSLLAPNGSVLLQKTVSLRDGLAKQTLPTTGRYTVLIDPRYGEQVSAQVSLGPSNMVELDGDALVRANAAAPSPITFESEGGNHVGLGLTGLSVANGSTLSLSVFGVSTQCDVAYGRCDLSLPAHPAGVYVAEVRPSGSANAAVSYRATLSRPKTVPLSASQATDVVVDRPGQIARLEFDLAAGQNAQVNIAAPVTVPAQAGLNYLLLSPTGAALQSSLGSGARSFSVENAAAGRYTLVMDAPRGETWSAQASLEDPYAATPIDSGSVELRTQGANGATTLNFANPSTADIGLGLSGIALLGADGPIRFAVADAQGRTVAAQDCTPTPYLTDCEMDLPALAAGRYTLRATPPASATAMRVLATLSRDATATLAPTQPLNLQIARWGQNARVAVAGRAGATLNLSVSSQVTEPAGALVAYTVRAPDGRVLAQNSVGANGSGGVSVRDLPSDGDYQVFVDPGQAARLSAQLAIVDDFSADLVANADPLSLRSQLTGQTLRLNFQAAQGARLGLGVDALDGVSIPLWVRVRNAAGAAIASTTCDALTGSCALDLDGLDAGSYVAELEPAPGQAPYGARVSLSSDQEHTLTLAQPLALNIERWGQNARLWFQGEAGQYLTFAVSGHSHGGQPPGPLPAHRFAYTVYGPDGAQVMRGESEGDAFLRFGPLAASGAHYVRVDPLQGDPMSAQVRLDLNPDFGLLETDGAPLRMAADHAGQALRFGFDVAADSALSLDVAAVAPVASSGFEFRVVRGNDPALEIPCGENALGCTLPLNALPPGRYQASLIDTTQTSPQPFAIDATLSTVRVGDLTPSEPYPLQLRSGQPARLRLPGNAGQRWILSASDQVTTPAAAVVSYRVRGPNGAVLDAAQTSDASFAKTLPPLPADGDYTVEVTAAPGVAVQTLLRLDPAP
ncbi:Ig-like domain-containing protein [Lysobacter sp. K5869]|uniref:Ig-like domain-containing protein n=1 Tax=Lysobacter sp. K5869 TaxID=2820808 RepID=UPI001C05F89E|nr:Ig-like domain-containing protein [Lysobacter sp. K5869]QWP74730.1 Ig-like domain-containing protein [Lysobacter sp. K5869]